VLRMRMPSARCGRCLRFSFSLCESFFSFHRSLQHGRVTRRGRAVIRGSDDVGKEFVGGAGVGRFFRL
jgi:hypothetical protein